MDRDAHARAARRRLAQDALAFEQDRESVLVEQLEDVVAEIDGPALDDGLLAQMSPEAAGLVLAALGQNARVEADEETDEDDDAFDAVQDVEEEIARLQAEIESSRRIQAVLGQYLDLLSAPPTQAVPGSS